MCVYLITPGKNFAALYSKERNITLLIFINDRSVASL